MEAAPGRIDQAPDGMKSKSNGPGPMLIHLEAVTKVFYTDEVETHALSGIYLDIQRGEYLSISGPSGCGKSTLLSILGLLDSPTDGKYTLNSAAVEDLSISDRTRIRIGRLASSSRLSTWLATSRFMKTWNCP
jgi:ABC-type nitrate/sulfonate/bicarbonate transport system ATPase subunit